MYSSLVVGLVYFHFDYLFFKIYVLKTRTIQHLYSRLSVTTETMIIIKSSNNHVSRRCRCRRGQERRSNPTPTLTPS